MKEQPGEGASLTVCEEEHSSLLASMKEQPGEGASLTVCQEETLQRVLYQVFICWRYEISNVVQCSVVQCSEV